MNRSIAFLGFVTLGLPACGDSYGFDSHSPDIRATPVSLEFGEVAVGERAEQTVRLSNPAEGTLVLTELRLDVDDTRGWQISWNTENEPATAHPVRDPQEWQTFDPVLAIEPGGEFFVFAAYTPLDDASISGALALTTNVAGKSGLRLSGSGAFTPKVDGRDPRGPDGASVLADPDADGVAGLGPGAHFVVEVHYAPTAQAPESAVLTLESNDPARPVVTVELTAQGD